MYLHTRLEGKKSNVYLNTSYTYTYGLTLTVHLLDGHFTQSLAAEKI